jgi:capping protein beta
MVEDMENKIRNTLNEIYFGKTHNVVTNLRSIPVLSDQRRQEELKSDLAQALTQRRQKNEE